MLASAVAVEAVAILLIGLHATSTFVRTAAPQNMTFWRSAPVNVALPGIPFRWLTRNPWQVGMPDVRALAFVLATGLVFACVVAAFRTPGRVSADWFWAAVPWMILGSPLAWEFYAVLALPLAMIMAGRYRETGALPPLLLIAAVALVLTGSRPGVQWTLPTPPVRQLTEFALTTYGLLGLAAFDWLRRDRYEP
jgi:hypothetical protein